MFKQVIVVRADLKMGSGKMAAQVAHASVGAFRNASAKARESWEEAGEKKVVVKASGLEELENLRKMARSLGIPSCMISDAGKTELEPGTVTALGLGPAEESELDKITGRLKLA
jgi:PTH2 family peptidyl-tRNA hydrolase